MKRAGAIVLGGGRHETDALDHALARIAGAIDPGELGTTIADQVIASLPELAARADASLRQAIVANVVSALIDIRDGMARDEAPSRIVAPAEATALAHELVHRGIDLTTLLRGYRLGHAMVMDGWERAAVATEPDPELRWRVLSRAARYVFAYVDAVSVQLTDAYTEERGRWVRQAAAARAELVHAILESGEADVETATGTLGYDVRGRHLAFVMWYEPAARTADGTGALEGVAASLAAALGGHALLLVPVGGWVVWGWTSGSAVTDRPDGAVSFPPGVRAAVGTPGSGVHGFVRSHRDAQAAQRVAGLLGRSAPLVRHEACALLALLTADPAAAVAFVESELGGLAADDDAMARLRATLRVYLAENTSPARTARRLGIHHNTVVYRVNKAEELLGRPIKARRLELESALQIADSLAALRAVT